MKKKFLSFWLGVCFTFGLYAQDTVSVFQQETDHYLQYLDKSKVTTGILYDRTSELAELDTLSDLINSNTDLNTKIFSNHFLQAWKELYDASYDQSNMMKPSWLNALITEKRMQNKIPIGVINYKFNLFDPACIDNGLIYQTSDTMLHDWDGLIAEKSSRSSIVAPPLNPYLTKHIFLASPLLMEVEAGAVEFVIPTNMFYENHSNNITSLMMQIGSNGFVNVNSGGTYSTTLVPGEVTITFQASFQDKSTKIVYATIQVKNSSSSIMSAARGSAVNDFIPCNYPSNGVFTPLVAQDGFPNYGSTNNISSQMEIGYYYANCSSQTLHKPIIILDGFDPGDTRNVVQIYDLLGYKDQSGNTKNLGEDLRAKGYDVVVVNFPNVQTGITLTPFGPIPIFRDGGADYIERNALGLVTLIRNINSSLQAAGITEKIVIVGPSMGGLISRYALSFMEKNNENTNCRLWISFDSPHAGANIPIGSQYWLEYYARVGGKEAAARVFDSKINSIAAKQLLIDHIDGRTGPYTSQTYSSVVSSSVRQQFLLNLANNASYSSSGFPNQNGIRKIAVTNGSGLGLKQDYTTSCMKAIQLNANYRNWVRGILGFLGYTLTRRPISESKIYLAPGYGNTCKIFEGWYTLTSYGHQHQEEKFVTGQTNTISYDIAPGGYFNTFDQIKTEGSQRGFMNNIAYVNFSDNIGSHSFIPTVSALALRNPSPASRDWTENLSNRDLVCTGETPFDTYFTAAQNESHVFVSAANAPWITAEIDGIFQSPTVNYAYSYPISIVSGDEPVCNGTTYQLPNLPSNYSVSWRVDPPANAAMTTDPVTRQVTISKLSNGSVTLYADVTSSCGSFTVSREISLGIPSTSLIEDVYNNSCYQANQTYYFRIIDPIPGVLYKWGIVYPNGSIYMIPQAATTPSTSILFYNEGSYGVIAIPYNTSCGDGPYAEIGFYVNPFWVGCPSIAASNAAAFQIKTAPNPVHGELFVTITSDPIAKEKSSPFKKVQIQLFDFFTSKMVKTWSFTNDQQQLKLNVRDVKQGNYILTVTKGDYRMSKHIVLE